MLLNKLRSFTRDYLYRHRNGLNIVLHIIGIPLVFFGVYWVFSGKPKNGFFAFFLGYFFQWIGHTYFEKNELGEWMLIKRIINKFRGF